MGQLRFAATVLALVLSANVVGCDGGAEDSGPGATGQGGAAGNGVPAGGSGGAGAAIPQGGSDPADCGNGVLDPGESCDPPESCPITCEDDGDGCTTDTLTGSAQSCTARCTHESVAGCEPFSIVLLPDTQYYTVADHDGVQYESRHRYRRQTEWIVDNQAARNIKAVIHLGDITNNNLPDEWAVADEAHGRLDAAGVLYSVTTGNHDYRLDGSSTESRLATLFEHYFSPTRFAALGSAYGPIPAYSEKGISNYILFDVGPMKFMVVSLEYAPREIVIAAAEEVIAAHPDRQVIIATHCYLSVSRTDVPAELPLPPNPEYGTCPRPDIEYNGDGGPSQVTGEYQWNRFVSKHANIFMVVSGHVPGASYLVTTGDHGNKVHQFLVDYQNEPPAPHDCAEDGVGPRGNGWMRLMTFDPAARRVTSETLTREADNPVVFGDPPTPAFYCDGQGATAAGKPNHYQSHSPAFDYDPMAMVQ